MRPDDNQTNQLQPVAQRGTLTPVNRDATAGRTAAAQVTRTQLDSIYHQQAVQEATTAQQEAVSPYDQTQDPNRPTINQDEWKQYHSSWQDYYQKYYEQYYVGAVQQTQAAYRAHAEGVQQAYSQELETAKQQAFDERPLTQDEALGGLRQELLGKVAKSAEKVRRSRHFIPITSAAAVLLVFGFMQYNAVIFSYAQAYMSPGNVDPQNIIVDPNASTEVSDEPRMIFPRFNIDVPVAYENTMGSTAKETHDLQMAAMYKGVAYFGAQGFNAHPGEKGNFAISGHSSNDVTDSGAAKFVFAPLLKARVGDQFMLNYQGTRYTYSIKKIVEVAPTDVSALQVGSDKPMATLITCTPLGTADRRLLLFGEQISPNPDAARTQDPSAAASTAAPQMAGKSPTIFERLFGAN